MPGRKHLGNDLTESARWLIGPLSLLRRLPVCPRTAVLIRRPAHRRCLLRPAEHPADTRASSYENKRLLITTRWIWFVPS